MEQGQALLMGTEAYSLTTKDRHRRNQWEPVRESRLWVEKKERPWERRLEWLWVDVEEKACKRDKAGPILVP